MIDAARLVHFLQEQGVSFFTGVPDSLLKDFCGAIQEIVDDRRHVIAANEGGAIGLAAGYHLATGEIPLVYLQNSGLGNTINPLVSLADPAVYSLPMVLVIGWRGEPGTADEPQHRKQGELTLAQLDTIGVPTAILPEDQGAAERVFDDAITSARERGGPVAVVVPKGMFSSYVMRTPKPELSALSREQAIDAVTRAVPSDALVVATTGKASRELYELRRLNDEDPGSDFLTVGSMGHASMIATGVALSHPDRTVVCLDGDGALLMHMGAMGVISKLAPKNLLHVVLNNGAHESVGGQPTSADRVDLPALAAACGYSASATADTEAAIDSHLAAFEARSALGPTFLEVRVACGSRSDLGRPASTPIENKQRFMEFVQHASTFSS